MAAAELGVRTRQLMTRHALRYVEHVLSVTDDALLADLARSKARLKLEAYGIFSVLRWRLGRNVEDVASDEKVRVMNRRVEGIGFVLTHIIFPERLQPLTAISPEVYNERTMYAQAFDRDYEVLLTNTDHEVTEGWQDLLLTVLMEGPRDAAELRGLIPIVCERNFIQRALMQQVDLRRPFRVTNDINELVFRTESEADGAADRFMDSIDDILNLSFFTAMLRNVRERGSRNGSSSSTTLPSYPSWLVNIAVDLGRRYVQDYPISRNQVSVIAGHTNDFHAGLTSVARMYSETPTSGYLLAWQESARSLANIFMQMAIATYDAILPERTFPSDTIPPEIQERRNASMEITKRIVKTYLVTSGTQPGAVEVQSSLVIDQMISAIVERRRGSSIFDIFTQTFIGLFNGVLAPTPAVSPDHPTANRHKFTEDALTNTVALLYRNLKLTMFKIIFEDVLCTVTLNDTSSSTPTSPIRQQERDDSANDTDDDRSWHTDGEEENNMDIDNASRASTPPQQYVTRDPRKGKWPANDR
jgi:hypothetical protein